MVMKVASYNIRKAMGADRRRSPERILEVLGEVNADVVALQEADRRFGTRLSTLPLDMIAEHTSYQPVSFNVRPGGLGWHGNAILVRKTAEILGQSIIALPTIEPRGAVMAEIMIDRQRLRVIGMHLDISGLQRRRQVRTILTLEKSMKPMPTIMMGDLNEWSLQGGCLKEFARNHFIASTAPSFHARRPIARLDRIVVSRDLEIMASGTHHSHVASMASDHLPVWAEVRIP